MRRHLLVILCLVSMFACIAQAQSFVIQPVLVASGTTLTFYLQTRLHPNSAVATDALPQGTILRVKMLGAVDSSVDHDGTEFHGVIVSPVVSGTETIVHPDAEVRGILVLLRSKNHPEGFRYELMVTRVIDHGKSYDLTASLNASFFDAPTQPAPVTKAGAQ
ncbi:MAG TPA: hypothetical protein VLV89_12785 [Candidatus Acidoferrum sp.]|nr:hypothetical protein [Candidatus Acidoferrum sp.]